MVTKIKIVNRPHSKAAYPKFDKKGINVGRMLVAERPKEVYVDIYDTFADVIWESQEAQYPSKKFFKEIGRAFKQNNFPEGYQVHVKFSCRDSRDIVTNELIEM